MHGWFGRDYTRYIPGLYWRNYFSHQYAEEHGLDVTGLAARMNWKLSEMSGGWLLHLYDSPEAWRDEAQKVDDFLFDTPGFFSKRRLEVPASVSPRQTAALVERLGREWP